MKRKKAAPATPRAAPLVKSKAFRLALFFTVLIMFVAAVFSTAFAFALRFSVRQNQSRMLSNAIETITRELNTGHTVPAVAPDAVPYFLSFCVYRGGSALHSGAGAGSDTGGSEEVLYTNDPFMIILPKTNRAPRRYIQKDFYIDGDLNVLYKTQDILLRGESLTVQVSMNYDQDAEQGLVAGVLHPLAYLVFPIIIISAAVAFFITRQTMKPVTEIARAAETISFETPDKRFPLSGAGDEFDELSSTFNRLLDRLVAEFKRERQFTSDVSHELKTPLTVILGNVNLLRRWGKDDPNQLETSLSRVAEEAVSMQKIIERLLLLSRLDAGFRPHPEAVLLAEQYERIRDETFVWKPDVKFEGAGLDTQIFCDRELLHEILTILTSNSIRYAKDGGLNIRITGEDLPGKCRVTFSDNGQGIAPDKIDYVFERFFRGDEAHTRDGGLGLGLSIAKSIMDVHGGSVRIASDGASGTDVTLEFPKETHGTEDAEASTT